ncbi:MAG: ImmA/IrrE family metallo-endopeptidase [Eubacterium sp.]|nr:ImmA/IrrE family metallo-endopeptidase [Eubacterium sp.]
MENNDIRVEIPQKLYDRIEKDVVQLHIELGLSVPVDAYEVARKLGFCVIRFSELDLSDADLRALRNAGRMGVKKREGLSIYDSKENTYVIYINDIDSSCEEHDAFTIMHEIGHIRMNHKVDSVLAEMVANYYAGYALVPSPLLGMYNCQSANDIIKYFNVSWKCASICLQRYFYWDMYSRKMKKYEEQLIEYYENKIGEKSL